VEITLHHLLPLCVATPTPMNAHLFFIFIFSFQVIMSPSRQRRRRRSWSVEDITVSDETMPQGSRDFLSQGLF
jgi:hypothetical protein